MALDCGEAGTRSAAPASSPRPDAAGELPIATLPSGAVRVGSAPVATAPLHPDGRAAAAGGGVGAAELEAPCREGRPALGPHAAPHCGADGPSAFAEGASPAELAQPGLRALLVFFFLVGCAAAAVVAVRDAPATAAAVAAAAATAAVAGWGGSAAAPPTATAGLLPGWLRKLNAVPVVEAAATLVGVAVLMKSNASRVAPAASTPAEPPVSRKPKADGSDGAAGGGVGMGAGADGAFSEVGVEMNEKDDSASADAGGCVGTSKPSKLSGFDIRSGCATSESTVDVKTRAVMRADLFATCSKTCRAVNKHA